MKLILGGAALLATLAPQGATATPFEPEEVAEGIYLFPGEDIGGIYVEGNSVLVTTEAGLLVYDTGARPSRAERVLAAIRKISRQPVRYIVNSEWHPDHYTGNAVFKRAFADVEIVATERTRDFIITTLMPMRNTLSASVLRREEEAAKAPDDTDAAQRTAVERAFIDEFTSAEIALPTLTYSGEMILRRGGTEFRFMTLDGDAEDIALVHLPERRALLAGDVVVFPLPYTPNSYAIGAWRKSLEQIMALDVDVIVPGHGPALRDKAYVQLLIDVIASAEAQVRAALIAGVKSADLTAAVDLAALKEKFVAAATANADDFDAFAADLIRRVAQEARDGAQFVRG